jgi:hypothetical protein
MMKEDDSRSGRMARVTLALAGPISWPTLFLAALFADHVGHAGDGLGLAIVGLGIILAIHVLSPLCLAAVGVIRKRRGHGVGLATKLGLTYYALAAVVAIVVQGPTEIWKDALVLTKVLTSPITGR